MAEQKHNDLEPNHLDLSETYGGTDVSLDGLGKFIIHLIVLVGVSAGIVYGVYVYLRHREKAVEDSEVRTTELDRGRKSAAPEELFPTPRLQTTAITDLIKYRTEQLQKLETYGWDDQGKGTVRLPIEEAKKRFLEEEAKKASTDKMTPQEKGLPAEAMRSSQ